MTRPADPRDLAAWRQYASLIEGLPEFDRRLGAIYECLDVVQRRRLARLAAFLTTDADQEALLLAYLLGDDVAADLLADRLEEGGQSGRASRVRGKKSK